MKCELAAALLHRPTTLFLDEPTIGLDVAMQVAIRDFIRSYNQRHEATVMLTSHYMDDVVALCPRIIVIDGGKLIHDGDLRQLIKTMDPDKRVSFTLADAGRRRRARASSARVLVARRPAHHAAGPRARAAERRRPPARHADGRRPRDRGSAARGHPARACSASTKAARTTARPAVRSAPARTLRALPTLLRIGVAETVAYRAEFLVWMLTTTMPLVMLGAVDQRRAEAPFRGYTRHDFVAYYLAKLIVRNLTGNWVAWQISEEIRLGTLSMRLLRPIHPFIAYATSHLGGDAVSRADRVADRRRCCSSARARARSRAEPLQLALLVPSLALAWLITFGMMFAIGCASFFITKAIGS